MDGAILCGTLGTEGEEGGGGGGKSFIGVIGLGRRGESLGGTGASLCIDMVGGADFLIGSTSLLDVTTPCQNFTSVLITH